MLTRQTFQFLALGALASLTAIALPPRVEGRPTPPPPDYYPLPLEAWWKYQSTTSAGQKSEFTVKVLQAEKQNDGTSWIKTEVQSGSQFFVWYSKPKGQVLEHKTLYPQNNLTNLYEPVKLFLKNPLTKGDRWNWKGTGMMGVAIEETSQVVGAEEVVVPAGKFSAMKVETTVIQAGTEMKRTQWFANQVGMVKSLTESAAFQSTTELMDYSFRKKK
ncbi:hypothetical protein [Synechocystis sp. LKSZ1]|uniref:TapB family protein n=1 Tax=Synechocystis sp. LKSZ1 TaxID=3144951 RepID=UPI00336BD8F6